MFVKQIDHSIGHSNSSVSDASVPPAPSSVPAVASVPPALTFDEAMTEEQLIDYCARLRPGLAALQEDSTLCVTPLITKLVVNGTLISLSLDEQGRWGAGYVRVSDVMQRSSKSVEGDSAPKETGASDTRGDENNIVYTSHAEENVPREHRDESPEGASTSLDAHGLERERNAGKGRRGRKRRRGKSSYAVPDGHSEEEQITRQIHHFVKQGQAFRIYSDAGITGEYPTNDPKLIQRLLNAQAIRYAKIFSATLLDETSIQRRGPDNVASMRAYLEKRIQKIRQGGLSDDEIEASEDLGIRAKLRLRSGNKKAYFRQAFTQLWQDIGAGCVHTVAASDRSRLCRAVDMETEFLSHLFQHNVRLFGLIEDMSSLDVSCPLKRGMNYFIGALNEYRLEEIAGHALRGVLQLLESGRPNGRLPWWLERDENGFARLLEGRAALARRIVEMSLSGVGVGAIANELHDEGVRIEGKSLTRTQIQYMLQTKALAGVQSYFGLDWPVYIRVIDDVTLAELQEKSSERAEGMENLHDTRTWAEHLLTGVCFCACGSPMFFQHGAASRPSKYGTGYYACRAAQKESRKDPDAPLHAYISEAKLGAFISEIFRDNPRLIFEAVSSEGDRAAQRRVRRTLLEEELRAALARYEERSREVQREVATRLSGMGLAPGDPGYDDIAGGFLKNALREESEHLATLQKERAVLAQETSRDRSAERALAVVDDLAGWDNLDIRSRNRLLRAIFSSITVYALGDRVRRGRGGYLEIKMAGVETPLPPVKMRRGYRRGVDLPTAAEWIAEIFAPAGEMTEGTEVSSKAAEPFRQFADDPPHGHNLHVWAVAELSGEQRERITAILAKSEKSMGRRPGDPVPIFLGIVWRFVNGSKWTEIDPQRFGGYSTCHRYFKTWWETGAFARALQVLAEDSSDPALQRLHASVGDGSFYRLLKGR